MSNIPLDPARGGSQCITPSALKNADIIVSTTGAAASVVIRTGTSSAVSHAMLYTGDGNVIEAVGQGVRSVPLSVAFHGASLAVAYRMTTLSHDEAIQVVNFALRQRGKAYDYTGAAGAGVARNNFACAAAGLIICVVAKSGLASASNKFFCSQLVLAAFASANHPLSAQAPATSVPNDIPLAYSVGRLEYVGHLVV